MQQIMATFQSIPTIKLEKIKDFTNNNDNKNNYKNITFELAPNGYTNCNNA